jgi:uncharacterized membrane protein
VRPHTLRWVWALSTIFVLSIISVAASWADGPVVRFISLSGLLLLTPMALFSALALSVAPFLRSVAAATFVALNVSSAGALLLAWHSSPYDEDGSIFGSYVAVSVAILVISFGLALRAPRRRL